MVQECKRLFAKPTDKTGQKPARTRISEKQNFSKYADIQKKNWVWYPHRLSCRVQPKRTQVEAQHWGNPKVARLEGTPALLI